MAASIPLLDASIAIPATRMCSIVQPNQWVGIRLPTESVRVFQIVPNTTISLGKYGAFPSNLIIHRPFHLTYEVQERLENETYNRLRVVPAAELQADILVEDTVGDAYQDEEPDAEVATTIDAAEADLDAVIAAAVQDHQSEQQGGTGRAINIPADSAPGPASSNCNLDDDSAHQTLTMEEIEQLKKNGRAAGKDLIKKLLLSHTALDKKTAFSLEKYKLLKTRKYIRRFCVIPLHTRELMQWVLDEKKDSAKILDMRQEMMALLGCWANVHYGSEPTDNEGLQEDDEGRLEEDNERPLDPNGIRGPPLAGSRYLVIDDLGGALVAAMAERMGILHPLTADQVARRSDGLPTEANPAAAVTAAAADEIEKSTHSERLPREQVEASQDIDDMQEMDVDEPTLSVATGTSTTATPSTSSVLRNTPPKPIRGIGSVPEHYFRDDMHVPFAGSNTITLVHANSQPNLAFLRYYDYDLATPNPPYTSHPLYSHLMAINWLQLLAPEKDRIYSNPPAHLSADHLLKIKANRRGTYHRKRRRWARTRYVVDSARAGGFTGLVVASTMDPVSILRHTLPLLAPGAPIAIYSPTVESLAQAVDYYSIQRRTAWLADPPPEAIGKTIEELDHWPGSTEFPLNPTLLVGVSLQTSRVRQWQVLPGRTHPMMTSRGGAEGYILTAWRAVPVEGKVAARGLFKRRRTDGSAISTPTEERV